MRSEQDESIVKEIREDIHLGDLAEDGCQYRPHIVWFEEPVPMIQEAIPVVNSADIFVVVGTSLVVYPAAGLVNYIQPGIPFFVIDKKIPSLPSVPGLHIIEKAATEGVADLIQLLKTQY